MHRPKIHYPRGKPSGYYANFPYRDGRAVEARFATVSPHGKPRGKAQVLARAEKKGPIADKEPIGQGIHLIDDHWIVVSGMKAVSIHKKTFERKDLIAPIFGNKKVRMSSKEWVDLEKINPAFAENSLKETFAELKELVSIWEWTDKDQIPYMTAAVMLLIFQQALDWRPLIYISGAQGTGKSMFSEFIYSLLSGFCEVVDKTTSHAVKQTFGHDSKPGFLDEFEHYRGMTINGTKNFNKSC